MRKKILITGATGLIGSQICKELFNRGDLITIFSRNIQKAKIKIPFADEFVEWDYNKPEIWKDHLNLKDAVIHLAGANLFEKRWTEEYKKELIQSRELGTGNIVKAMCEAEIKPKVFVCASGIGYYGDSGENILNESSPAGQSFTARLCKKWEEAASEVERYNIRRVSIRTAVVFNKGHGALRNLTLPFNFFVGGTLGSGNQWFPWIHIKDLVNIYLFAVDNKEIAGSVNASAPDTIRLKELTDEIGKILHRPSLFKVPGFILKIALGEFAEELLASSKVIPEKLKQNNFKFRFGNLKNALDDLIKK